MHPISDKELDKLFQQKFQHAEQPAPEGMWLKVSGKLNQPVKSRRQISVFWMAAASVICVVSAAIWLSRPAEVIKLHGVAELTENSPAETFEADASKSEVVLEVSEKPAESRVMDFQEAPVKVRFAHVNSEENERIKLQKVEESKHFAAVSPKDRKIEEEMFIPEIYTGDQSRLDVAQTNMIARLDEYDEESANSNTGGVANRRIRSVGSLVNFVVSKVDKRDNKIIEFKDSGEGSEISGINLGPLRFKSKK